WSTLFDIYNRWKNFDVKIEMRDKIITAIYQNPKEIINARLNGARRERTRRNFSMQFEMGINLYLKQEMDIKEFINKDEERAAVFLHKVFSGYSFDSYISGVKLKDWLRSYSIVQTYNINSSGFKQLRNKLINFQALNIRKMISFNISDILFIKSKKWWIKKFIKGGIDKESAIKLFAKMVYEKNSTDNYDFPFIKINNKIATIPFFAGNMNVGYVLENRLSLKDVNFFEKGAQLEKHLLKFLDMYKIKKCHMHNKENNEEYECDVAFIIKDTLFLCECKSRLQPDEYRNYIYEKNKQEDINQIKRITNFYSANKEFVVQNFKKEGYKISLEEIKKIKSFVIYSDGLFGLQKYNDIYLIDIDKFNVPFRRDFISNNIARIYPSLAFVFKGEYTPQKIFTFYNFKKDEDKLKTKAKIGIFETQLGKYTIKHSNTYFQDIGQY
ncbi:MAG: hypothetical protein PHN56_06315, partial [Candidatus Nanoarchaeia archaeon]|nr:hypothetical protein [Candidatus Nanoarchaeia archaeon]